MHVIRRSEYREMSWKNGGGTTTELYASPGGKLAFDWRVSIATVNEDGPFSAFPGCERHIMVLSGNGMRLEIAGRGKTDLQPLQPFSFSGDAGVAGILVDGPVQDFNLIVREEFGSGVLRVMDFEPGAEIGSQDATQFFYVLAGANHFTNYMVDPMDSFWLDQGEQVLLKASMKAVVCEIIPRRRLLPNV
jgi:environmental stress-induced protein Ves